MAVSAAKNQIPAMWMVTAWNQNLDVHERVDPYWIDVTPVFVRTAGKFIQRCRPPDEGFPEFFRHDRAGRPRGVIRVIRSDER